MKKISDIAFLLSGDSICLMYSDNLGLWPFWFNHSKSKGVSLRYFLFMSDNISVSSSATRQRLFLPFTVYQARARGVGWKIFKRVPFLFFPFVERLGIRQGTGGTESTRGVVYPSEPRMVKRRKRKRDSCHGDKITQVIRSRKTPFASGTMEEVRCRRFTLCGVVRPPATLPGIRNQLSIQCYVFLHTNEQRRQMWRVRKARRSRASVFF
ncbi:hypothetical protein CEXT_649421 [Caerostris extrusa]|uniref:Uncharacterized protein n=1 Tax=Caerostris extrusa TaxID=172846 RepID=A0AAV4RRN1_CAEEX|nr:hypothetical protein CEXT_649421 [Caerostris extrusa]